MLSCCAITATRGENVVSVVTTSEVSARYVSSAETFGMNRENKLAAQDPAEWIGLTSLRRTELCGINGDELGTTPCLCI